ncbi:hypothetical protein [Crenothrix sp.]
MEQYFDMLVLKQIENGHLMISQHQKQPARIMQVAVEDFATLPL